MKNSFEFSKVFKSMLLTLPLLAITACGESSKETFKEDSKVEIIKIETDKSTVPLPLNEFNQNIEAIFPNINNDVHSIVELGDHLNLIILKTGQKFISGKDGKQIVMSNRGKLVAIGLKNGKPADFIAAKSQEMNQEIIKDLGDYIEYKAENEVLQVSIFHEPYCGFCHKAHENVLDYLANGITVRYYPFPLFGEASDKLFNAIWSEKDPEKRKAHFEKTIRLISNDKERKLQFEDFNLPEITEEGVQSVQSSTKVARMLGFSGTPAFFDNDGKSQSGFLQANEIKDIFGK